MKVFFVGDTSNRTNWGCRATTQALKSLVRQHADISYSLDLKVLQEPDIGQNSVSKSYILKILNKLNKKRLTWFNNQQKDEHLESLIPLYLRDLDSYAKKFMDGQLMPFIIENIQNSDVVVINGEGGFLSCEKSLAGFSILFIAYLAKHYLNKPCILVNHTADVRHPQMYEIAKYIYPMLDDAVFREPISFERTSPLRQGRPALMAPDALFSVQPASGELWENIVSRDNYFGIYPDSAEGFNARKPYICVGGSAGLHPRRRENHNPYESFLNLCRNLQSFAPVVVTSSCAGDEDFLRAVATELRLPYFGTSTPTFQGLDVLANASLYVGGRWHPSIMALTGGTPIVSFSSNTDYKSKGLLMLAGLEQPVFNAFELNSRINQIVEISEMYLKQNHVLRNKLKAKATELSQAAQGNVRFIANYSAV